MFSWYRGKKEKEVGKQSKLNDKPSDSGNAIPVLLASGLDEKSEKTSHDNSSNSRSTGHDYSGGFDFDGGSGGGSD